jgi:hypothetical protein
LAYGGPALDRLVSIVLFNAVKALFSSWLHATVIWLLLVSATGLAWWLVECQRIDMHITATAALVFSAFKVRLVFLHFMELRTAPLKWRLAFEAWVIFFFGIILTGYWF